jgi:hypothetical protein
MPQAQMHRRTVIAVEHQPLKRGPQAVVKAQR